VFDRYDITSEEDLAEASRKLQALAGTISGTLAKTDAEALQERIAKSVTGKKLMVARGGIEPSTLRFSVPIRSLSDRFRSMFIVVSCPTVEPIEADCGALFRPAMQFLASSFRVGDAICEAAQNLRSAS